MHIKIHDIDRSLIPQYIHLFKEALLIRQDKTKIYYYDEIG